MIKPGKLYIVSTPIGNLEDITLRAINTLKTVDYIACEDTRHSQKLLNHYEINRPLISYHSHSGQAKIYKILEILERGRSVAVISDAGTPGISDPSYTLIQAAISEDILVVPIPGPAAPMAALVGSGMHMHQFIYLGFLPLKKGRQTLLKSLADNPYTIVIFESPHRVLKTFSQLKEFLGDRKITVARELTKVHEEFFRGTISEAIDYFTAKNPKGEFTLVIEGA